MITRTEPMGIFDNMLGTTMVDLTRQTAPLASNYLDACRRVALGPVGVRWGGRQRVCYTLDQVQAFYAGT